MANYIDEGYIKFACFWKEIPDQLDTSFSDLIVTRNQLYQETLIGFDPHWKVGYGNISKRCANPTNFVISGSQTGHIEQATTQDFCTVTAFDLDQNTVHCSGPIKASSESMTHAAIYACDETVQVIIHVHNKPLWEALLHKLPTTAADVPYGTPEMGKEIFRLFEQADLGGKKVFAMAGHEDGVFAFGATAEEALNTLNIYWAPVKAKL